MKLAAGNWKMNGLGSNLGEVQRLIAAIGDPKCQVLICPPATLIDRMSILALDTPLHVGSQDCHAKTSGAHTGDVSAAMLANAGASYVIVGHSERRADHGETDAIVLAKTQAVLAEGLIAIVCVGETEAQRDAGDTLAVVGAQLAGSLPNGCTADTVVVAYEPVWAIGTGRTATPAQAQEVHAFIRGRIAAHDAIIAGSLRVLYGGSVKAGNARELFAMPDVDGGLVGGASLKADEFVAIVAAAAV